MTMKNLNEAWRGALQRTDAEAALATPSAMAWMVNFLRINSAVCKSLRSGFLFQMGVIYEDLLKVRAASPFILF